MADQPLALMAQQAMNRAAGGAGGEAPVSTSLPLVSPVSSAHQQLFNSLSALMTLQPQLATGAPLATAMDFSPSTGSGPCAAEAEAKLVDYRGEKVAGFVIDGETMICLPQAYELFLKNMVGGLHTVYTKLKRLDITPRVCNVEQVRALRSLGSIQPGVNRCKLIACKDFDALYDDCTSTNSRPGRPAKRSPLGAVGLLEHRWSAGETGGCNGDVARASPQPAGVLFGAHAPTPAKRHRLHDFAPKGPPSGQQPASAQVHQQGQPLPATILPVGRPQMPFGATDNNRTGDDEPQGSTDEQSPCSPVNCGAPGAGNCPPSMGGMPAPPIGLMPQFFGGPNLFMHQLLQQAAAFSHQQQQAQNAMGVAAKDRNDDGPGSDASSKFRGFPQPVSNFSQTMPPNAFGPLNLTKIETKKETNTSQPTNNGRNEDNNSSRGSAHGPSTNEQQTITSPSAAGRDVAAFPFGPVPNPLAVAAWAAICQKQQAALAMAGGGPQPAAACAQPSASGHNGQGTSAACKPTGAPLCAHSGRASGDRSPSPSAARQQQRAMCTVVANMQDLRAMMTAVVNKLGNTFELASAHAADCSPSAEELANLKKKLEKIQSETIKEQNRREQVQKRLDLEKQIRRIYQSKCMKSADEVDANCSVSDGPSERGGGELARLEALAEQLDRCASGADDRRKPNDAHNDDASNNSDHDTSAWNEHDRVDSSDPSRDSATPPAKLHVVANHSHTRNDE